MMRGGAGFNTDRAWWQLLDVDQNVAPLELTAENHIALRIDAMNLENDFAISRPIVVTVCMSSSSESWEP
jgi:hypothetical protein